MVEVNIYSHGIVHCSVCAPASMTAEEVTEAVNRQNPAGDDLKWKISDDKTFRTGELNGYELVCDGKPTRHWLMSC